MLSKYSIFIGIILGIMTVSTFAADSILQNLQNLISSNDGSYQNQKSYSQDDLKIINAGNDTNPVGDYFQGHYFDPMHGNFQMKSDNTRVKISSTNYTGCNTGYNGKKLTGYSWSELFGYMNFSGVSICLPTQTITNTDSLPGYLTGYAWSPLIGYQSFNGWQFDSTIDICDPNTDNNCDADDSSTGRLVRVEGNTASKNQETGTIDDQFDSDVRIIGNVTKSSLRKNIHQNVYSITKSLPTGETTVMNATVKVYKNPGSIVVINQSSFSGNIRTILIENGSAQITGDIRNPTKPLGVIALSGNATESGNIYIKPSVTDIEASLYTDRSVLSFGNNLYTTSESQDALKNQLYIYGSVFSENTIGGSFTSPVTCPYYVKDTDCSSVLQAQKYDINFLRRYKLVTPLDASGNPGTPAPAFDGQQSYARTNTRGGNAQYKEYPVIIEYNPNIQNTPPPLF